MAVCIIFYRRENTRTHKANTNKRKRRWLCDKKVKLQKRCRHIKKEENLKSEETPNLLSGMLDKQKECASHRCKACVTPKAVSINLFIEAVKCRRNESGLS